MDKFRFSLTGATIPSITEQPVKSLGKIFDCSLKDAASIQKTGLADQGGKNRPAGKVQGLDLPAFHTTPDPVASAGVCSAHNDSRGTGEEDQQLLAKMARPTPQSEQCWSVWHQ